ncbi:MAG: dihydroneopterin aldolase [Campylobacteraceae bacterium]|nr:dihydroneopterin aldolase [Campylobacteraceae bacterium]
MKIQIKELSFNCIIGILPIERIKEQKVIINASFIYTYQKDSFIDYSLVANDIKNIMINKKFELLEDALLFIKNDLETSYKMKKLRLKITKPDILPDCFVSVSL